MLRQPDKMDRVLGNIKALIGLKYLGANPRSILVNLTALPTSAATAIHHYAQGGKGSITRVLGSLAKASKDYTGVMAGKKLTDADEQALVEHIQQYGYDNPQLAREIMKGARSAQGNIMSNIMNLGMWGFAKSEQLNRGATILAAYRAAKRTNPGMSHDELVQKAWDVSNKAHGIYDPVTNPFWAMGDHPAAKVARMSYTFQKFGHNYLQMMADIGFKNPKALAFALISPAVLAGARASALYGVGMLVAQGILKAMGDDRDPERWFWDTVREMFGEEGEQAGRYGVVGQAMGVDIRSSLEPPVYSAPANIKDLFGAFGGLFDDFAKTMKYLGMGEYVQAAENLLPNFARNVLKAQRESKEGATTTHGNRVWDKTGKAYQPTAGESVKRALGFRSPERAMTQERQWEAKSEEYNFSDRKSRIYEKFRDLMAKPDRKQSDLQEFWKQVRQYNNDIKEAGVYPRVPAITMATLRQQMKRMSRPQKQERLRATR